MCNDEYEHQEDYRYDDDDVDFTDPSDETPCVSCGNESIIKEYFSGDHYCADCYAQFKKDAEEDRALTEYFRGGR